MNAKPQAMLNHWRGQANRLPLPTMEGERCISPAGVFFQVRRQRVWLNGQLRALLAWEMCTRWWWPLGIVFRERIVGCWVTEGRTRE